MQINIPTAHYEGLARHAAAAGYGNVEAFIAALAEEPTADPRGPLSDEELHRSAAECDRGIATIGAGAGRDLRQAMLDLGCQRGYAQPQ